MHYLIQTTLEELKDATRKYFDGVSWVDSWDEHGGGKFVAQYTEGQANFGGPLMAGNPNLPYYEVICSVPALADRLSTLGNEWGLMIDEVRKPGHLRGVYKASIANPANSRSLIHNSSGNVIGVTADFTITGRNFEASFLAGEDPEEAEEILGLE